MNTLPPFTFNNYIISNTTTYATITPKVINNTITSKNYDGTNTGFYALSGYIYGDNITISGSCLLSNINVGLTTLTLCGSIINTNDLQVNNNYILQSNVYSFNILPIQIIPTFNIQVKTYDKIINNVVLSYSLSGIVNQDIGLVDICNTSINTWIC
jgi:hypothetical protein